jgi:hypothetical protein
LVDHSPRANQVGTVKVPFSLNVSGLSVVVPSRNESHPIKRFEGSAYFRVTRHDCSFKLVRYGDASDANLQVEAAVAPVSVGALQGNFVVVMRESGGEVLFVPDRPSKKGD